MGRDAERERAIEAVGASQSDSETINAPSMHEYVEREKEKDGDNLNAQLQTSPAGPDDLPAPLPQQEQDQEQERSHDDPPDGGLRAWAQVLANHLIVFNSWGFILSFGIFQPYYESALSLPPSTISWIGSVQVFLIFLVGALSGRAFDAGYFWHALITGSFLQVLGIFMMSVSTKYWHLFLAQGVCQGLGCGIVFAPTVANTATYFRRKRVMAISLGACGTSTGGIVFPLMAQQLLPRIGFGWTMRAMGLVVLVTIAIVFSMIRTRHQERRSGPLLDLSAFKEPTFTLFAISAWITLWAIYFAYYYARSYPLTILHAPESTSFAMLLIISATGIPGRLIPAYLADRYFGPVTVFIPAIFISAILTFSWAGVSTVTGNYVWVAFFGFFGASIQALFPSTCANLTTDMSKNGTRLGMMFTLVSVAALTGPPVAGKLIQVAGGSYIAAQMWGGACMMVGLGFMIAARAASQREARQKSH